MTMRKAAPGLKKLQNKTGIPGRMKADFENDSGISFDDVRVHYHSDKPAQIQAFAYTQGTQIYIGSGQEKYLNHELGHVVQQKQGIVHPTAMHNGLPVNRSHDLENAADTAAVTKAPMAQKVAPPVIQGKFINILEGKTDAEILELINASYELKPVLKSFYLDQIKNMSTSERDYPSLNAVAEALCPSLKPKHLPPPIAFGAQRDYEKTVLESAILPLYSEGIPKGDALLRTIAGLYPMDVIETLAQEPQFITDLQSIIRACNLRLLGKKKSALDTEKAKCERLQDEGLPPQLAKLESDILAQQSFFDRTEIKDAADPFEDPHGWNKEVPANLSIGNFKLRHYTPDNSGRMPAFGTILSTLSLKIRQIATAQGGHTNDTDWAQFGNIGNTFFVLLIGNDFVCKQPFIAKCKYYTELPIASITKPLWISSDWLSKTEIKGTAYEGTPEQVHRRLLDTVYCVLYEQTRLENSGKSDLEIQSIAEASFESMDTANFANLLGRQYHNFEVKVRGPVDVLPNEEGDTWKMNPEATAFP